MRPSIVVALAALLALSQRARAQVTSLDEGSLIITRAGERIGREDYWIRAAAAASGSVLVAQATIVLGSRRVKPGLNADTSGAILRFQSETRVDGRIVESYSGQTTRDHYAARTQREKGESAREFRLPPRTVAVDDDVLHQLWFVVRRGPDARVSVLVPGRSIVESVHVELVGPERLAFEVHEVDSRHFRLRTERSGLVRDVWIDGDGHLLKVAIPSEGLVALRDDLR